METSRTDESVGSVFDLVLFPLQLPPTVAERLAAREREQTAAQKKTVINEFSDALLRARPLRRWRLTKLTSVAAGALALATVPHYASHAALPLLFFAICLAAVGDQMRQHIRSEIWIRALRGSGVLRGLRGAIEAARPSESRALAGHVARVVHVHASALPDERPAGAPEVVVRSFFGSSPTAAHVATAAAWLSTELFTHAHDDARRAYVESARHFVRGGTPATA